MVVEKNALEIDSENNDNSDWSTKKSSFVFLITLPILLMLAALSNILPGIIEPNVSKPVIEYVVYAVLIGLLICNVSYLIPALGSRYEKFRMSVKTELLIKIGLVLYGAKIGSDFSKVDVLGGYFLASLIQGLLVIITVFLFAYYVSTKFFKIEAKFAAVLSTAVSICGVSAAIAAAGAVLAEKKELTHAVTLIIAFALPMLFILPYIALILGFPAAVAGAWIGGNIDTTAAVLAAGSIFGEEAASVAAIVKITQNIMIGFVAFFLAFYFSIYEKKEELRPNPRELWTRFPKFVIGFMLTMILALPVVGIIPADVANICGNITKWFFAMAFVSIGLTTKFSDFKQMGLRPAGAYASATIYNTLLTLVTAFLLFGLIIQT